MSNEGRHARQSGAERLRRALIEFGFASDLANTYINLLSAPTRVHALQRQLGGRRAQEIVDGLLRLGLSTERFVNRRRVLHATNPEHAWTAQIADRIWGATLELAPLHGLPTVGDPGVNRQRDRLEEIRDLASTLCAAESPLPRRGVVTARRAETVAELATAAIGAANKEIRAVSRTPRLPQVSLVWSAIEERLRAGVEYRRITDLDEVVDHGLATVRRDLYKWKIRLRVLPTASLPRRFYVVDRRYLVLENLLDDEESSPDFSGVLTPHSGQIARYRRTFDRLWNDAIDGGSAVESLQSQAQVLQLRAEAHAAPEDAIWFRGLVRLGKFNNAQGAGLKESSVDAAFRRLRDLGLVHLNREGSPVPNYDLEVAWRTARDARPQEPCPRCWNPGAGCEC